MKRGSFRSFICVPFHSHVHVVLSEMRYEFMCATLHTHENKRSSNARTHFSSHKNAGRITILFKRMFYH